MPLKPVAIRFDVSILTKSPLGSSLTLDVDTGPETLTDLRVNFLRGTIHAVRIREGLLLQGTVHSQLELECVRCLEHFLFPVAVELEEIFWVPGSGPRPEGAYVVSDSGWLDLAPLLREQIWVAIPMKPLCRPDCKGLCPNCGANLNLGPCECETTDVDPRLAALKAML